MLPIKSAPQILSFSEELTPLLNEKISDCQNRKYYICMLQINCNLDINSLPKTNFDLSKLRELKFVLGRV